MMRGSPWLQDKVLLMAKGSLWKNDPAKFVPPLNARSLNERLGIASLSATAFFCQGLYWPIGQAAQ
jgi:hypothetical protein